MRSPMDAARRILVAAGAALVTVSSLAYAYVPPSDFLLKLLAEKRRDLGAHDISAQLRAEVEGSDTPADEYLYIKTPERLRLLAQREDGNSVYIEREGQRAAGPEKAPKLLRGVVDLTAVLLAPGGRDLDEAASRMRSALRSAGVDTTMVSLGRQGDNVAYIIGARPFEPDKPQVWLSKSSLEPLKTIVFDKSKSPPSRVETRFIDFGSPVGGDYLPAVIEVYRDGKRVRRAELNKVSVNHALPETLFDLPRAR
jgi:hypothetical protein